MDATRLSVVVPTRDTRELTLRCLGSLEDALDAGLEVIVVDDGSQDDTAEAVNGRFRAARVLRHESAQGFTASANEGLRGARGEILLLLNSDAEVAPGALWLLVDAFARDPRLGVASPRLVGPDRRPQWSGGPAPSLFWLFLLGSGLPAALRRVPGSERWRARLRGQGRLDWVPGAAMAMRRRAWDEVGPFDTRFRFYAQDLDFCTRAAETGWRVRLVEEAHVVHVGGATIGREPGATRSRSHPGLLWTDLLLWAEKTRGPVWASSAARFIALGARLRLLARAAVLPLMPSAEREEWRHDSGAFRQALDGVRRWQAARRPQGYEAGPGGTGGCGTGSGAGAPPG